MSNIIIDSRFDSGSIDVMTVHQASAMLRLKNDKDSEFKQWFHFRVANCGGRELVLKIVGLNDSAYPAGWPDYRAVVSEDRIDWTRADTSYDEGAGVLTINVTPVTGAMWIGRLEVLTVLALLRPEVWRSAHWRAPERVTSASRADA